MPHPHRNDVDPLHLYRELWRIRIFEEHAHRLYQSAKMPGLTHLYIGQEAVAVGMCEGLRPTDRITSTHRGHGHCLAKGGAYREMFCELLGRAEGYCGGKGGSLHIADQRNGNLGANAIVGGAFGIATGAALAARRLGRDDVTVCFFGDGATAQGLMYEVMNMAALWRLPVIYLCENNLYGEYTRVEETAAGRLGARAEAFGIETFVVDGQDVLAVSALARELTARCRQGQGPFFVEAQTYRYHGHHVGDVKREYRTREEESHWKTTRDPIANFGAWITGQGLADAAALDAIRDAVAAEAQAAVDHALAAPFPPPEDVHRHVFADA